MQLDQQWLFFKKNIKNLLNRKIDKNLPVTRSNSEGSYFKNTTLFPLNLSARRISIVPVVMLLMLALKTKTGYNI